MSRILVSIFIFIFCLSKEVISQPIHRYSFDGSGGNGAVITDTIGGADGTLIAPSDASALTGTGHVSLMGGLSNTAGYVDLPNGLLSSRTDITLEGWITMRSIQPWSRIFDFGSTTGGVSGELFGPGGGGTGLDYLTLTLVEGTDSSAQFFSIYDTDPIGNPPGPFGVYNNRIDSGLSLNIESHFAVVYDADGAGVNQGKASYYRDGGFVFSFNMPVNFTLSNLNDVNNWLGRSNWTNDFNSDALYNEFRIYDEVLSAGEIASSFVAGPDNLQVPEPSTMLLLGIGLVGLAGTSVRLKYRRKYASA